MCDTRAKRDFLGFFGEGARSAAGGRGKWAVFRVELRTEVGGVQLPLCDTCKDEPRRALKKAPCQSTGPS